MQILKLTNHKHLSLWSRTEKRINMDRWSLDVKCPFSFKASLAHQDNIQNRANPQRSFSNLQDGIWCSAWIRSHEIIRNRQFVEGIIRYNYNYDINVYFSVSDAKKLKCSKSIIQQLPVRTDPFHLGQIWLKYCFKRKCDTSHFCIIVS